MEQFIRYLYEYQQGQPIRNVGFVRVERDGGQTTVHIHGKGLQLGREAALRLYIFFAEQDIPVGIFQGMITNINPAVNYRLTYTQEDTGTPENYSGIRGIIMKSEGDRCFAAVWSDLPVNVTQMREWEEPEIIPITMTEAVRQKVAADAAKEKAAEEKQAEDGTAERLPAADVNGMPEVSPNGGLNEPEKEQPDNREEENMDRAAEEMKDGKPGSSGEERNAATERPEQKKEAGQNASADVVTEAEREIVIDEEVDDYIIPSERQCKKICRQDIAMLPRCEWRLANNSFLLHGCYNYHHLMLIQEGDELWLGVPGIYHSREAKAAEAFGFPRFIPMEELDAELRIDEKEAEEEFGYWSRKVRKMNNFAL